SFQKRPSICSACRMKRPAWRLLIWPPDGAALAVRTSHFHAQSSQSCDFFVSCDSVVPLKRDSNDLSSPPGIPLPLHAGLLSCVSAGTWFHSTRTCLA